MPKPSIEIVDIFKHYSAAYQQQHSFSKQQDKVALL
jgi:hypothetical protein